MSAQKVAAMRTTSILQEEHERVVSKEEQIVTEVVSLRTTYPGLAPYLGGYVFLRRHAAAGALLHLAHFLVSGGGEERAPIACWWLEL